MKFLRALVLILFCASPLADEGESPAFDRSPAALKRGAEVVTGICMGCHSLKYVKYRDLAQVGYTREEVNALRGAQSMDDPLMSLLSEEMAVESFGLVPPDQSLMAKARAGGATYIYRLVTGFARDQDNNVVNREFMGIRMPDVLDYASASGAQREKIKQQVQDAAVFLEWASDPRAGERRSLGYYVLGYLVVMTLLLYLLKQRVWRQLPLSSEALR